MITRTKRATRGIKSPTVWTASVRSPITTTLSGTRSMSGSVTLARWLRKNCAMKKTKPLYHGHRFPAAVISCAVRWYFRFQLSLLDIKELLFERGVIVNYETVRRWCDKFEWHNSRQISSTVLFLSRLRKKRQAWRTGRTSACRS
jgi:hypothetical protein